MFKIPVLARQVSDGSSEAVPGLGDPWSRGAGSRSAAVAFVLAGAQTEASEPGRRVCLLSAGAIPGVRSGGRSRVETKGSAHPRPDTAAARGRHREAGVDFTQPVAVMGDSDVAHVFYKDDTNNRIYYRTLSARTQISANGTDGVDHALVTPVRLHVGSIKRIV